MYTQHPEAESDINSLSKSLIALARGVQAIAGTGILKPPKNHEANVSQMTYCQLSHMTRCTHGTYGQMYTWYIWSDVHMVHSDTNL